MILGLIAGRLAARRSRRRFRCGSLLIAGGGAALRRTAAALAGHLPGREADLDAELGAVQRRLVLPVAGGVQLVIDVAGWRRWAFPLVVIGTNSIAAYLIAHLWEQFVVDSFRIHLGADVFQIFGTGLRAVRPRRAVLLVFWLILFWMYRRKIFLRI